MEGEGQCPGWGSGGRVKCYQAEAQGKLSSTCCDEDAPLLQSGLTLVCICDALLHPSPQGVLVAISGLPGGRRSSLLAGPLASPSSGSQPPPPGRRGWSVAAAGPPVAADTSLGRTCTHSAPSVLGPEEKAQALSQPAPSYLTRMKGTPSPGSPLNPLSRTPQLPWAHVWFTWGAN